MNVAISGSSGLIGSALVPALERAGHRVIRLPRGQTGPDALAGADAVVNLSGERIRAGRWTKAHKRALLDSRIRTTTELAESMATMQPGPRILLNASAIGIYGSRGDEELTEVSASGEGFLAGLCSAWEAATTRAQEAGVRVACLRSGLVLAARAALVKAFTPPGPFVAGRLGAGDQWMSWISIDDEVGAIRHLLETDSAAGAFNLTGPAPVTNREFVQAISAATGKRALPPVPAALIKMLFGREAAEETALTSQRVLPVRLDAAGYVHTHPTLDRALEIVFPDR